jgi:hypothetical protein
MYWIFFSFFLFLFFFFVLFLSFSLSFFPSTLASNDTYLMHVANKQGQFHGQWPRPRRSLFKPGEPMALLLADRFSPACIIGDNLFVHAGIDAELPSQLSNACIEMKAWLRGGPETKLVQQAVEWLAWSRDLHSEDPEPEPREAAFAAQVREALHKEGIKRIICGHTPGSSIRAAHDQMVILIDASLCQYMQQYGSPGRSNAVNQVHVLVLDPGNAEPQVLSGTRPIETWPQVRFGRGGR